MTTPAIADRTAVEEKALRAVLATAAALLCAPPARARAVAYLAQRGLDPTALPGGWPLGYAPPGWTRLTDKLLAAGHHPDQLVAAGVARPSSRGTLIDTFHDRVIFPVHDHRGRLAGFLGRDLSGAPTAPKYLNTAQTALYDKGKLLYGLHENNQHDPNAPIPVLVEGPLDVIAIATAGRSDLCPVAACGTHLTGYQAALLSDLTGRNGQPVVLAMDGDPAGRHAALTTGQLLRRVGIDSRIAALPPGADPASYLATGGDPAAFTPEHALPLLTVQVQQAIDTQGDRMQWIEGRLAAARAIATLLLEHPTPDAAGHIGWIAAALDITASSFLTVLAETHHTSSYADRALLDRPLSARSIA